MNRYKYLKKSIYNSGKDSLEKLLVLESDLNILKKSSIDLQNTLTGLGLIEKKAVKKFKNFELDNEISFLIDPDWANFINKKVKDQIIFVPHHFGFSGSLSSGITLSKETDFSEIFSRNKERVYVISAELRNVKMRLRHRYSPDLVKKIRDLVLELRSLISFHLKKHRKNTRVVRLTVFYFFTRDLRNIIRNLVGLIFKFLCDVSGCAEEEEVFTNNTISKQFSFNFQSDRLCSIKTVSFLRSINTSSQYNIN